MAKRQVFYSFHYANDNWRASQVRNIGAIEGNKSAPDNDWETIKRGGDPAIKKWIDDQLHYRSCTIVLVGSETYDRKWIKYEIEKSWNEGMGVLGIRIHNLKDSLGRQTSVGRNPFDYVNINGSPLSKMVQLHDPNYVDSKLAYEAISNNISNWIEQAIEIRKKH